MAIQIIGKVDFSIDDPSDNVTFAIESPSHLDFSVESGGGGVAYHPVLGGRELPDQHPIEAITDLNAELEARPSEAIPLSYIDALR